jgi:hypothetical protein
MSASEKQRENKANERKEMTTYVCIYKLFLKMYNSIREPLE